MIRLSLLAAFLLAAAIEPAFAHHAMDGQLPGTFMQGLLSGLGHPVIGLDHLAFILAAGLLAAPRARGFLLPLAFVAASAIGVALHLRGFDLPGGELLVAGSVVVLGLLLVAGRRISDGAFAALLGIAGICHGYAFGESIVGAEATPLAAYFLGLALIQYAISASTVVAWRALTPVWLDKAPRISRFAGAAVTAVGAAFLVLNLAG